MYENQTFEAIFERMLANIGDDIDKREGSVAYDMLAPKAAELAMIYIELDNIANFGFADTTYGQWIDLKVKEVGMTRASAVKSTGQITFQSSIEGLVIPQGSIVYTDSGIRFLTQYEVEIVGGSAIATIIAETGGISGNVPANSIINNEINELVCFNASSTTGGSDIESDEELLKRYYKKVQQPATSGNVYHYKQWATEVPGVGDAKVFPIWNGNGTVKVVVVDLEKEPVTTTKVTEVANYIETVRPVGATVTVESAVGVTINVDVRVTLNTGYSPTLVKPVIEQKITDYFKTIAFIDSEVKYTKIASAILDVDGVIDYSTLTVNNGTVNIPIGTQQVPVLGVVNLL